MKNTLLAVLFFLLCVNVYSQEQKNDYEVNQYLEKSLRQKKTGNVLLLTGAGLVLTGVVVGNTGNQDGGLWFSENQMAGAGILTLGVLSALTSVPFYISAHHVKTKTFKISPTTGFIQTKSVSEPKSYPAAGLKIAF